MTSPPTYDQNAIALLVERTQYEAWLLEAVYAIVEEEWFPCFPDEIIYPIDSLQPKIIRYARANIVIGDWRPGFLTAGTPLVFIATFKLLDMFIEWVLEKNGYQATFRFQEKIKHLNQSPLFPALIDSRLWLKDRLIGLYRTLEPLRGTIIHDKHFTSSDGALRVSSRSKDGVVNPPIEISSDALQKFAFTIVSILKYVDGTWSFNQYREKILRHNLDGLTSLHGSPSLGQLQPFYPTVRLFSTNPDPRTIDFAAIRSDVEKHHSSNDCMFDLRVLLVKEGAVVDAFLFPWVLLENEGTEWGSISTDDYRIQIPSDIKPEHLDGRNFIC